MTYDARRSERLLCRAIVLILALFVAPAPVNAGGRVAKNEVTMAEHFLVRLEREVERHGGKPFKPHYDGQEALRRIKALKEKYPDDPEVEALFQRARKALMASKGQSVEITPAMLEYREQEKKLTKTIAMLGDKEWALRMKEWESAGALVDKVFPSPDPMKTSPETMIGRVVVFDDFAYPDNEFTDTGGQFVYVGSGTKGYYYVELSCRAWQGAYGAIRRYRMSVNNDLAGPWKVAGRITGVTLLVPQAGKKKTLDAAWGWVVSPVAIQIPGRAVAWADSELLDGGVYAGEVQLDELKEKTYTFNSLPGDVEPLELVEIFATAIKEKNWNLYLECIDPARQRTKTAISRLRYFYEDNLERYRTLYVYVHPMKVKSIEVIKGFDDSGGSDEDFFLDDAQRAEIKRHSEDKVEEAKVTITCYDERGRQVLLPKNVTLRRYGGGRWYIAGGYPL